jgi:hypothetical protein
LQDFSDGATTYYGNADGNRGLELAACGHPWNDLLGQEVVSAVRTIEGGV